MLRDHEEPHGHHVVILPLVVGAGSISKNYRGVEQDRGVEHDKSSMP